MIKNKLAVAVAATFLIGAMGTAFAVDGETPAEIDYTVSTIPEGETGTETTATESSTETSTATATETTEGSTETATEATEGSTETASGEVEKVHLGQAQSSLEKNLEAQPENQGLLNALSRIFANQERHADRFTVPESSETDSTGAESNTETESNTASSEVENAELQTEAQERDSIEVAARPERPERPEKPEKPERPERPERPEKPEKPERPERPEAPGRS